MMLTPVMMHPWMKFMLLMLMMSMLIIMIMMILLMMIMIITMISMVRAFNARVHTSLIYKCNPGPGALAEARDPHGVVPPPFLGGRGLRAASRGRLTPRRIPRTPP